MKKKYIIAVLVYLVTFSLTNAQTSKPTNESTVKQMQPVIMVIPRVNENEDIRTILDNSFSKRSAVSIVKEAFDNRGFTTKSFEATLKIALNNQLFTSDNQTDMKSIIIEMSAADIYVEVDIQSNVKGSGASNVNLILEGSDCTTGASYSNKLCSSGYFNVSDTVALINRALSKCKEEFLNTLQEKFDDIVENGRSLNVSFKLSQNSAWNFDKEINDLPFSDVIEEWVADNALKNNYNSQGKTKLVQLYEIRVPLRDDRGRNYTPSKFSLKIYRWLKTKKIKSRKEVKNGTIFITIL